ncbi:phosphoethanolamine transferase domain-containing protein, partial [Nocardioides stalactiti]|uniref:phosphoethanolamine transferase domain-containing protein n=1 Tax=Nocardioides stalactiti TaxID=2755356 RepID=UPI001601A336
TNDFLIGGEGDPGLRADYDAAIQDLLEQIAAAADAQPADEKALQALIVEINDYTTAVTEARANSRQQLVIGNSYLSGASAALRTDAQPILANLVESNTERAEDSMSGQHPFWLLLIGIAAVAVLVWVSMVLAGRFRRYLNVGVSVAGIIVLVVTFAAVIAAWRGDSQNDDLLENELAMAVDQAAARTAGNDAKAYESLRLILQGSGPTYEPKWEAAAEVVEERADRSVLDEWNAYADGHAQIVTADDRDRWFDAKRIAIDPGETSLTANFDRFDEASQALADENGAATTDALRAGRSIALLGSLLTLVLGFVSAVAVARGIGARRKEYA